MEIEEDEPNPQDKITLKVLVLPSNRSPFVDWFDGLKTTPAGVRLRARLIRWKRGNVGDFKPVGSGVFELRLDFGPGYRIYFAQVDATIVVLIGGGDKSTQQKDIDRAIRLWEEYKNDAERIRRDF